MDSGEEGVRKMSLLIIEKTNYSNLIYIKSDNLDNPYRKVAWLDIQLQNWAQPALVPAFTSHGWEVRLN